MILFSSRITNPIPQHSAEADEGAASRRGTAGALILVGLLAGLMGALPARSETLPRGTELTIRLERDIEPADKKSKGSDKFSAPLAFPVFANGQEVLPAGSRVEGEIRGSKKLIFLSPRRLILPDGRQLDFHAVVSGINQRRLKASEKEGTIEGKSDRGAAAQQAGETAATGAIIGAMTTGTWEGVAIGAAAGAGAVLIGRKIAGHKGTTVIPAGTQLTLDLNDPLEIPGDAANAKAPEDRFGDRQDRRPILRRADEETPATP